MYIEVQFINSKFCSSMRCHVPKIEDWSEISVVLCSILKNSKTAFDGSLSKNFNKIVEVRDLSLLSDRKHDEF